MSWAKVEKLAKSSEVFADELGKLLRKYDLDIPDEVLQVVQTVSVTLLSKTFKEVPNRFHYKVSFQGQEKLLSVGSKGHNWIRANVVDTPVTFEISKQGGSYSYSMPGMNIADLKI